MKHRFLLLTLSMALLRAEVVYKVRLGADEGGRIVELSAEKYVAAVSAGEAGSFRNPEALKAMAIAARTYAAHFRLRHKAQGYDFCSTTHCQRAILKAATGKFEEAAHETRGQLIWFRSQPAAAWYTQDCGGKSEAAGAIWPAEAAPYLTVHEDPYCAGRLKWSWEIEPVKLRNALRSAGMNVPASLEQLIVLQRTASGRAQTLGLQGGGESKLISAGSFRFAVGRMLGWNTLRSEAYLVRSSNSRIEFDGRGAGHGVGLCQDGADEMAAEGDDYRQILSFYYPGTRISVLAKDVEWTMARGKYTEAFAVQKADAEQALAATDIVVGQLRSGYGFVEPTGLQVYVYPDMDAYRNGTGEPGWVAAHTAGMRIETQPLATLQQHGGFARVMRHELLHAMVESAARPTVPLWFREGLVEYLAGELPRAQAEQANPRPYDKDIARREDASQTREAYRQARERVAQLQKRYGTTELVRWVRAGVPAEVIRSSNSRNATNSR